MKAMLGLSSISLLRNFTPEKLRSFQWEDLVEEMQQSAPTLLGILQGCVIRNERKSRTGRSYRVKDESIIWICTAILLRHHNPQMNLIQQIVSLLLYSGHAPKLVSTIGYTLSQVCYITSITWLYHSLQVVRHLQKILLCLSHKRTIACVDTHGKGHAGKVIQWKDRLEQVMAGTGTTGNPTQEWE